LHHCATQLRIKYRNEQKSKVEDTFPAKKPFTIMIHMKLSLPSFFVLRQVLAIFETTDPIKNKR